MAVSAAQPTVADLLVLVGELRERIAALEAENARLRAAVAALRGADDATPDGAGTGVETATPSARKRPPR